MLRLFRSPNSDNQSHLILSRAKANNYCMLAKYIFFLLLQISILLSMQPANE